MLCGRTPKGVLGRHEVLNCLKLSPLAGHGRRVLHPFTPQDSVCSMGASFSPACSIVKVREIFSLVYQ